VIACVPIDETFVIEVLRPRSSECW
jgi:hypothetical protein